MNGPNAMDAMDTRILCIVQKDASLSIRKIAAQMVFRKPQFEKGYGGSMHRA